MATGDIYTGAVQVEKNGAATRLKLKRLSQLITQLSRSVFHYQTGFFLIIPNLYDDLYPLSYMRWNIQSWTVI